MSVVSKEILGELISGIRNARDKSLDYKTSSSVIYYANDLAFVGKKVDGKIFFDHIILRLLGKDYYIYPDGDVYAIYGKTPDNYIHLSEDKGEMSILNSFLKWRIQILQKLQK